jgi:2-polyprenyl-3-methyl-5-hydroxy-6-metoxy-1,4-benzoquinol methylase
MKTLLFVFSIATSFFANSTYASSAKSELCAQLLGGAELSVKNVGIKENERGALVSIERGGNSNGILYIRTNRNFDRMTKLYPSEFLMRGNLRGKKILDAPCGAGAFTSELNEQS